jgi:cell division septal protein FtsQ
MIRSSGPIAPAVRFRRPDGERGVRKSSRRMPARLKQFLALCAAAGAVFFVLAEVLIFGMTWSNLDVRDIRVRSADPDVRAAAERMAAEMPWGNIFVLDAAGVRRRFESVSWIREARVRKILPNAVEVEVEARVPIAILAKTPPVLIDAEGVEIGPAEAGAETVLPRFEDADGFLRDAKGKIDLGWSCLGELSPADRADVESLDLTGTGGVVLKLRSDPARLKLGESGFASKVGWFRERRERWEREFGAIESLDLRFRDRIFMKTAAAADGPAGQIATAKETR